MPVTPIISQRVAAAGNRTVWLAALTGAAMLLSSADWGPAAAQAESVKHQYRNPAVAEKPLGNRPILKSYSRFTRPAFYGKSFPQQEYKGIILMGNTPKKGDAAENAKFYAKVKESLDLIERKTPFLFSMLQSVNRNGKRIFFYTGMNGPASFNAWEDAFIVRITATHLDDRPIFDNNPYYLAATLVHEMIGHGRQAEDVRLWPMYDWCGKNVMDVRGVMWVPNRKGGSSGLIEYEANLYAQWFLESAQNEYPNYIEHVIKRYLRIVKFLNRRFPLWYDDEKPSWLLLQEFGTHFRGLCPGLAYTPHPLPRG